MAQVETRARRLRDGATVAIVGGGPAGSFLAIHLFRQAVAHGRSLRVVIFEHQSPPPCGQLGLCCGPYRGCPRCAGGVSPRLSDTLAKLDITVPEDVLQRRIQSISVQGSWKPVYLEVPKERKMFSVFRGTLPHCHRIKHASFDALLIDSARARGAELIGSRVTRVFYDSQLHPVVCYRVAGKYRELNADFVAFAGGINDRADPRAGSHRSIDLYRMLQPGYVPPPLRKALIVELAVPRNCIELMRERLYYVESSVNDLRLEMCSILPKDGYFTVTLIGGSVDNSTNHKENLELVRRFLSTPNVRRILPAENDTQIRCLCNPRIVVGTAKKPVADNAAVVGDMATTRQYKDGILAAHDMAESLATAIFERGIDVESLTSGYGPTLRGFRRDNRFAKLIFFLYRWFFTSTLWSRVVYQALVKERKLLPRSQRSLEQVFWAISSGEQSYEQIARLMLRPSTLWRILTDGILITLRNRLTELAFGLDWKGIGRFPIAVPLERLRQRRNHLLKGQTAEFECIYTIHVDASLDSARRLLGELGEPSRPFLHPRGVLIRRTSGNPLEPGCTIRYEIFGGALEFEVVQIDSGNENLIRYRVVDSFANGGSFMFMLEPEHGAHCSVTVYLAFNYARGTTPSERAFWWAFRSLFPEYIHDVLWNHALCEFKQAAECGRSNSGDDQHLGQKVPETNPA